MGDEKAPEIPVSQEILMALRPTERVLWADRPSFTPLSGMTGGNSAALVPLVIVFTMFPIMMLPVLLIFSGEAENGIIVCGVLVGVFLLPFACIFATNFLSLKNTEYALTNQRLVIQRGILSRGHRFIDIDKIMYIDIQVGMFERKAGTGSIHIGLPMPIFPQGGYPQGGAGMYGGRETLVSIKNPYEVQKILRDAIDQNKAENIPPIAIVDANLSKPKEMPCPKCAAKLELPSVAPNMSIRCPACGNVFKP